MADFIVITEDDIAQARDYMPIRMKEQLSRALAIYCIEESNSVYTKDIHPIPPVARERRWLRAQICMGVLAEWYLVKEIEHEKAELTIDGEVTKGDMVCTMSQAQFDIWSQSHVMNQLERLKASKTEGIRNKIYDILYDFKAFENMLYGAIRDELENHNDLCGRINVVLSMQMSGDVQELLAKEAAAAVAELAKRGGKKNE